MSGIAILMLVISIAVIWGGLALAIINLQRHPDHGVQEAHRDL